MHAHELADLSALVAVHGEQLVAADATTMDQMLTGYWKASRCRLDRWCRLLALATKHDNRGEWTPNEVRTVEEILVSEILTRLVTAIAVAHDERRDASESAPVARNIFHSHLDVKRRAIALVVAPHRDRQQADDMLALRRQCERWTDLLLAYLAPLVATAEFAMDAARVGDFAFDAREHLRSGRSSDMAVTMIIAGMRSSLVALTAGGQTWGSRAPSRSDGLLDPSHPGSLSAPSADLNLEIATAVMSGFAPDFFDSHGHLRSAWLERLRKVQNESPVNIENWWRTTPHAAHKVPRPARWQR